MPEEAVYVVVKYVDDLERQEPLNVGAVLGTSRGIWPRFIDREHQRVDTAAVQRFEELIRDLARRETDDDGPIDGPGFLRELADRSFSHFQVTEPRQVMVSDDPETALEGLCQRLVVGEFVART
jgi:hypothetical protein